MLKKIICDKFSQNEISFHQGLNAIVGDDIASNSIGKSTMLMIIDFVFGGSDYIHKNFDVIENLGHHEFKFIFKFDCINYYFIRNTIEYTFVYMCDENFKIIEKITIEQFNNLLQRKYNCVLESLSFRDIIGRYFRVYGKENLIEKKPIQYFEKESASKSILALLKLFDKYKNLKSYEEQVSELKNNKKVLVDAAEKNFLPYVNNKKSFNRNEKEIDELSIQLDRLKEDIITNSLDLELMVSDEVLKLKRQKSELAAKLRKYENRLLRSQKNKKNQSLEIVDELNRFVDYFPDFNVEMVNTIENFHKNLTKNLNSEIKELEREMKIQIEQIRYQIKLIDNQIKEQLSVKNAPKLAVDEVINLVEKIKQLKDANSYYNRKNDYEISIKKINVDLKELKEKAVSEICNAINLKMDKLNKEIYIDDRRSPIFSINGKQYIFNTEGDTGTGTAFANLISFDLSLLELTCLPAIAHDLPLLKNIENSALENIMLIYSRSNKQIFIAIDKLDSYDKNVTEIINQHSVLQLSKDKLLFNKNWKSENS